MFLALVVDLLYIPEFRSMHRGIMILMRWRLSLFIMLSVKDVPWSGSNEYSTTLYLRSTKPRWFWVGFHYRMDLFTLRLFLLRVLAMKPSCLNRLRSTLKCQRLCCRKPKEIHQEDFQTTLFKRDRTCSMCKSKYYASGVQCLLGNFNCLPGR